MQPLQAIVGTMGFKKIKKVIKFRNKNANYYDMKLRSLKSYITTPRRIKGFIETFALYMILCKKRDKLKKFLEKIKSK